MEYLFRYVLGVVQCIIYRVLYNPGGLQEWASVCICTWWDSGILSKPECYSDTTLT